LADNIIDLNSNFTTGTPTENAGLRIMRGDSANVQIRWNESSDAWDFTNDGTNYSTLLSASSTDTFTNKSISLATNTITSTLAQLNTAVSDADVASLAGTETLTNKTISLASNTITSTLAQLNTAVSDADVASLAGSETLTNKTVALGSNTVSGTLAQFNTAVTDADFASLAGSETLTNKTLSSAVATTALTLNATAELRLADTDSTHYVGFKSPGTVTTNKIWTLPSADGTANQVLSTDGSATLSWSTPSQGAAFSEFMLIGA
jgi:hypothetical protein